MKTVHDVNEAVREVFFERCPTFSEDMIRTFQYVLLTIESWVPEESFIDGLLMFGAETVGRVRCYFYGHSFIMDPSVSAMHCVCCTKIEDYG